MSRGLKPAIFGGSNVRAEARTYLRNKNKGDTGLRNKNQGNTRLRNKNKGDTRAYFQSI